MNIANRPAQAGWLLIAGLIGVGVYNWRLWQRDKALATHLRTTQPPVPTLTATPKVSVLVAAWNERAHIDAHLRSFRSLTYPSIELILCAGGTDDTLARARQYTDERVIILEQQPGEGKQRALARCLARATGDIIYLTDADCEYTDAALRRLLQPIIDEGEAVATGESRPLDAQMDKVLPAYIWATDTAASARHASYIEGLLGRNAALTRTTLDTIGGLDFVAHTGTDYQLARRLIGQGIAIRYVGASVVPSEYPETLDVYRKKRSRWVRNLLLHGQRYGAKNDVMVTLKTIATGALMIGAPLLALLFGSSVLALWGVLVAHAVSAKVRYTLFAARLHQRPVPIRLFVLLVPLTLIDFMVWALPMLDLIHPKRRTQW